MTIYFLGMLLKNMIREQMPVRNVLCLYRRTYKCGNTLYKRLPASTCGQTVPFYMAIPILDTTQNNCRSTWKQWYLLDPSLSSDFQRISLKPHELRESIAHLLSPVSPITCYPIPVILSVV